MEISFYGAVGTVTGSKYLLSAGASRVLVDCGLFQGLKQLRLRNWSAPPFDPAELDAVVLTHAHLDHSGYLPVLTKNGFSGPIYATPATMDLCDVLLRDSAFLQERDADFANRHKFSRHRPAKPLYTRKDAEKTLAQFRPWPFEKDLTVGDGGPTLRFSPSGHILGSAFVRASLDGVSVVFSGDLGRPGSATMVDPSTVEAADYLVVESTYGNRRHGTADVEDQIAEIVNRVARRGGTVLIPAFAVGRAQSLLFHLDRLKKADRIPDLPVFLDSPMAINATEIFCRHPDDHRLSPGACHATCNVAKYVREVEDSKALTASVVPKIIVSASGMATGGRILHHLKRYAPDARNAVLFGGFQAAGTRGAAMVAGADRVKIHGEYVPIKAEVDNLHMLSAHADVDEIIGWLKGFRKPPRRTFITHGEPTASDALRQRIEEELGWSCTVPEYKDRYPLT